MLTKFNKDYNAAHFMSPLNCITDKIIPPTLLPSNPPPICNPHLMQVKIQAANQPFVSMFSNLTQSILSLSSFFVPL